MTVDTEFVGESEFVDELAGRIYALQESPVLTAPAARRLVGKASVAAFDRWLSKYAPRARCGQGRYNKDRILQGLRMEAGKYEGKRKR